MFMFINVYLYFFIDFQILKSTRKIKYDRSDSWGSTKALRGKVLQDRGNLTSHEGKVPGWSMEWQGKISPRYSFAVEQYVIE